MSLLDDVSIVVTPNGYKAGELYAVVPVPTEGAEEITNGDFASDLTGWTGYGTRSATGGVATIGASANSGIYQGVLTQGVRYNVTVNVTSYDGVGTAQFADNNGNNLYTITETGIQTFTFISAAASANLILRGMSNALFSLSSVSVKEYTSADMDVTRATAATRVDENGLVNYAEVITGSNIITDGDFPNGSTAWALNGWTISDNAANCSGITANMIQTISGSTNKTYSLTFTISNYVSGSVTPAFVGGYDDSLNYSSNGTFTEVISSASDTRFVFYGASFNGSIDNVSVKEVTRDNVPRIDYTGGGCPHILAEPQSTNVLPYSEDFSQSSWTKSDVSIESGYLAPDGTDSAYKVTKTGSNGHLVDLTTGGNTGTKSIYAKTSSGTGTVILFNSVNTYFTITEEWQRFDIQQNGLDFFYSADFRGTSTLTEIIIWGAQSEALSYPTSYIPTSGSTVTRNKDQFSRDGIGSLINSTEGVLFVEMAALSNDGTFRIISLTDGGTTNRVSLIYNTLNNSIRVMVVSTSTVFDTSNSVTSTLDFHKIAIKWKLNDFAVWIDGVEVATDTSGNAPVGLDRIVFDVGNGTLDFFGKVKQLQVYDTSLSDEQLLQLTGESGTDFYESYAEMASALTYTIQ